MTATEHDYRVGMVAARNWLNVNESMYSGFIGDDVLHTIVKTVVDAVDKDRLSHQAKPVKPPQS